MKKLVKYIKLKVGLVNEFTYRIKNVYRYLKFVYLDRRQPYFRNILMNTEPSPIFRGEFHETQQSKLIVPPCNVILY